MRKVKRLLGEFFSGLIYSGSVLGQIRTGALVDRKKVFSIRAGTLLVAQKRINKKFFL